MCIKIRVVGQKRNQTFSSLISRTYYVFFFNFVVVCMMLVSWNKFWSVQKRRYSLQFWQDLQQMTGSGHRLLGYLSKSEKVLYKNRLLDLKCQKWSLGRYKILIKGRYNIGYWKKVPIEKWNSENFSQYVSITDRHYPKLYSSGKVHLYRLLYPFYYDILCLGQREDVWNSDYKRSGHFEEGKKKDHVITLGQREDIWNTHF